MYVNVTSVKLYSKVYFTKMSNKIFQKSHRNCSYRFQQNIFGNSITLQSKKCLAGLFFSSYFRRNDFFVAACISNATIFQEMALHGRQHTSTLVVFYLLHDNLDTVCFNICGKKSQLATNILLLSQMKFSTDLFRSEINELHSIHK